MPVSIYLKKAPFAAAASQEVLALSCLCRAKMILKDNQTPPDRTRVMLSLTFCEIFLFPAWIFDLNSHVI